MTAFAYELATVLQHIDRARPGGGAYALPWYLVIGEPESGRSTAVKALNLHWPFGDGPVPLATPEQWCSYWLPEKALFIEPEMYVLGPSRQPDKLAELCDELHDRRPREPIDGMLLVVSARYLADSDEDGVERYAKTLRRYLIEVAQALAADIPTYVVVTTYDDLWGFGDAFQWNAQRRDEEPWGFSLPPDVTQAQTPERVRVELEGLTARIESMCFARLSTEDHPDVRTRAFQHLIEARDLLAKLGAFMHIITMSNAFERSPWVRALAIGSGTPGTGHRLRHGVQLFASMGLTPPAHSGTAQPGGMPMHAMIDNVLLPERDLVPTRVRWRDDKLFLALVILAVLTGIAATTLWLVLPPSPPRKPSKKADQSLRALTLPMLTVSSKVISDQYLLTASAAYSMAGSTLPSLTGIDERMSGPTTKRAIGSSRKSRPLSNGMVTSSTPTSTSSKPARAI